MNIKSVLYILLTLLVDVSAMYFGYLAFWILGIFLTLILIASAVMFTFGIWQLKFKQVLVNAMVEKGNEAQLMLECLNKGIFLYPKVRVFYRGGERKTVSVYPGTQSVSIGYVFQRKGKYSVGVEKIAAYDAFGIFCSRVRFKKPEILYVLPKAGAFQGTFIDEAGRSSEEGMKKKKFEDRSTVSYLRDYQYGDTLNLINWKATAKHSEVIVNQHENEFCTRVFVYVDGSNDPDKDDYTCDLALTHVKNILDHDGMVTLLYGGKDRALDSKDVKYFDEYGLYLTDTPETASESPLDMAKDLDRIGKIVFQNNAFNQAVLYLQHDVTPEMEQLITHFVNMHIKVDVRQIREAQHYV